MSRIYVGGGPWHSRRVSTSELPTRLPRWMLARRGSTLPVERMRARLSAYVYGGILVLGAIAVASGDTIADGHAALVVASQVLRGPAARR